MKFLIWCVGWLVLSLQLEVTLASQRRILGVVVLMITWALLGMVLGLVTLVRLSLGKLGAGMKGLTRTPPSIIPAPQQKPKEGA